MATPSISPIAYPRQRLLYTTALWAFVSALLKLAILCHIVGKTFKARDNELVLLIGTLAALLSA